MTMRRLGFSLGPLALVLPLTFACSGSSGDGEGGGSSTPAGSTMGELAELGDKYVGENQATYDGVGFLAESLQSSLASGLPAAAFSAKQGDGCLPDGLAGVTHEFDAPSGMFVSGDIPGAPVDAARFNLYETNGGVPSSNVIGTLDVSCTGQFPSSVNLRLVVSADGTELLDLRMTNASFSPQFFSSQLDGSLNSPDGDSLAFGAFGFEGGSYISEDVMFGGGETLNFDLGDGIVGHVRSSVSQNSGFDEDSVFIDVYELYNPVPFDYACPALTFQADLRASGGGAMTGPGVFCAPPPTADGYNYHVACYEGTRNGVSVSSAAMSCLTDLYFLEPTQISGGDLQLIERGTNGILGMYRAVAGTAQAAGAFGLAVAAEMAQQQQF